MYRELESIGSAAAHKEEAMVLSPDPADAAGRDAVAASRSKRAQ
jgi:hypothetical protein